MALQRFVLPTVLKADDVVGSDRLVDRHRRLMLLGLRRRLCHIPEGVVNARDQLWYLRRLNVVLGNVSRHNIGAEADQVGRLFVLHRFSPVAGSPAEILRGAGTKALAVEDSRHYDIRPTATRIMVVA